MKKRISVLICIFMLFSLCAACSLTNTEDDKIERMERRLETPADLITYDTLEDFLAAAKNAVPNDEIDLMSLEDISVPSSLPDGYTLYKITAGVADIAFWYLPEEYLTDDETADMAEAQQKHFMFIDSRDNYDFDKVLNQLGGDRSQLIDNKYFVGFTSTNVIVWEEDGNVLWLHLPAEMTISDSETATMNRDAAVMSISESDFDAYCETECISIR